MEVTLSKIAKAFEERNYCVCENLLCELERDRDQNGLDERKLTVNRQLLSLAKSGWTNPDAYASALGRLAPDSSSKMLGDEIRLFNLCVVAFHSGQYKQAMNLAENVLRNDTDLAVVDRDTQLLRIELCLLLQQPQKAMNYLEQLKRSKVYDTSDIFLVNHIRMAEARTYLLLKRYFSFRNHDSKLSENQQWFPALCRAQCDHLTGNPRAALSLLLKASDTYPKDWQLHTAGESKQLVINNAFGCVYASRLRKPHLSLVYFQKALAAIIKKPEVPRPLLACPPTWRYGLLYNMALSLLQAGEPHAAFDCFLSVLQLFHENARLWLRLAECCILAHKSTNRTSFELVERMKEMIKQVIGIGPHRKVILRTNLGRMDGGGEQQTAGSGAIPMVSLEFASLCLRNALALLPAIDDQMLDRAAEMAEKGEQIMENNLPLFPAMPGPPLSVSEVHRIRCSTLCNLAYVSLSLNEVQMALRYSGKLMEQKYLSPAHSLMGRLYMSESSMLTGRVPDAIRLLDPDTVHKLTIPELWAASEAPLVTEWFPNTVPNAKAILIYNLAVVETINGNYQRANEILQQIQTRKEMNPSIQNLILALYVQLKLGNTEFCRALVMRTLPGHGR